MKPSATTQATARPESHEWFVTQQLCVDNEGVLVDTDLITEVSLFRWNNQAPVHLREVSQPMWTAPKIQLQHHRYMYRFN